MLIWRTIGRGGANSSPGQAGIAPILPSVPISQADSSAITMSAVPCVQRIGGFGSISTIPDQLQYFPLSAFSRPRVPGPIPGQYSDVT